MPDKDKRQRKSSRPGKLLRRLTLFGHSKTSSSNNGEDGGERSDEQTPRSHDFRPTLLDEIPPTPPINRIPTDTTDKQENVVTIPREFVKVKVVTWNMHENLPTGDLTDLLGSIPQQEYDNEAENKRNSTGSTSDRESELPKLSLQEGHPYHIVVVGAQECPYLPSTFLGEINSNLRGRENVTWTDVLEDWFCKGGGLVNSNGAILKGSALSTSTLASNAASNAASLKPLSKASTAPIEIKDFARSNDDQPASPVSAVSDSSIPEPSKISRPRAVSDKTDLKRSHSTYSSILHHRKTDSITSLVSEPDEGDESRSKHNSFNFAEDKRKSVGPYVLVAKERLMGIYVAVFVLKKCKHLLRGVSKAHVTAGLIGGRVGNKGAAAVSLNFAGHRFLFVSAHLAAHQKATDIRKQNVCKIKEELHLDTFEKTINLKHTDDITEHFDFAFWFGDLNYRLDVSRLHADWLLQTKSYQTALEFDQLKAILGDRAGCFKGFKEGPIEFAPTYKYDLINQPGNSGRRLLRLPTSSKLPTRNSLKARESQQHIENVDDANSTSPKLGSNSLQSSEISDDASFSSVTSDALDNRVTGSVPRLRRGLSAFGSSPESDSHRKGFRGLIRSRTTTAIPIAMDRHDELEEHALSLTSDQGLADNPLSLYTSGDTDSDNDTGSVTPKKPTTADSTLLKIIPPALLKDAPFDTSRKQRVQSWTDRILYKTTLYQDPVPPPPPRRLGSGVLNTIRLARLSFNSPGHSPAPSISSGHGTSPPPNQLRFDLSNGRLRDTESALSSSPPEVNLLRRVSTGRTSIKNNTSPQKKVRRASSNASKSSKGSDISRTVSNPVLTLRETRRRKSSRQSIDARPALSDVDESDVNDLGDNSDQNRLQKITSNFSLGGKKLRLTRTLPITASTADPPPSSTSPFTWRSWWSTHKLFNSAPQREEDESAVDDSEDKEPTPVVRYIGPVRGEIQCLTYQSVNDLHKMNAQSDHRPIYAEFAVGVNAERPT